MDIRKFISGAMAVSILAAAAVTASAGNMTVYDSGMVEWDLGPESSEEKAKLQENTTYYITDGYSTTQPTAQPYLTLMTGNDTQWLWYNDISYGVLALRTKITNTTEGKLTFTAPEDGTLTVDSYWTGKNGIGIYTSSVSRTGWVAGTDEQTGKVTIDVAKGNSYTLWCSGASSIVDKVTFKPEFSSKAAAKVGDYTEAEGDAAQAWGVTVDLSQYSSVSSSLKWVVNGIDVELDETPTLSSAGSVSFGLILTGTPDQLDAVNSVALSAE